MLDRALARILPPQIKKKTSANNVRSTSKIFEGFIFVLFSSFFIWQSGGAEFVSRCSWTNAGPMQLESHCMRQFPRGLRACLATQAQLCCCQTHKVDGYAYTRQQIFSSAKLCPLQHQLAREIYIARNQFINQLQPLQLWLYCHYLYQRAGHSVLLSIVLCPLHAMCTRPICRYLPNARSKASSQNGHLDLSQCYFWCHDLTAKLNHRKSALLSSDT